MKIKWKNKQQGTSVEWKMHKSLSIIQERFE